MSSVAYVEIYVFFEEDLMDPKSAVGGPKSISRTGVLTSAYLEKQKKYASSFINQIPTLRGLDDLPPANTAVPPVMSWLRFSAFKKSNPWRLKDDDNPAEMFLCKVAKSFTEELIHNI